MKNYYFTFAVQAQNEYSDPAIIYFNRAYQIESLTLGALKMVKDKALNYAFEQFYTGDNIEEAKLLLSIVFIKELD